MLFFQLWSDEPAPRVVRGQCLDIYYLCVCLYHGSSEEEAAAVTAWRGPVVKFIQSTFLCKYKLLLKYTGFIT